jgi:histone H3/H4
MTTRPGSREMRARAASLEDLCRTGARILREIDRKLDPDYLGRAEFDRMAAARGDDCRRVGTEAEGLAAALERIGAALGPRAVTVADPAARRFRPEDPEDRRVVALALGLAGVCVRPSTVATWTAGQMAHAYLWSLRASLGDPGRPAGPRPDFLPDAPERHPEDPTP